MKVKFVYNYLYGERLATHTKVNAKPKRQENPHKVMLVSQCEKERKKGKFYCTLAY
jgi:hypothetical protein